MHIDTLSGPERRVLGCLIEKRFTTPDQYPLTLNSLRLACNQSTNRDPVVDYDEETVRDAAQRLSRYGLTRLASGHSSRAVKYRHLADEALGLEPGPLAVLTVLLLRGAQTPGELKARSERMAEIGSLAEVDALLEELITRGYVRRLDRRPGQKEERYVDVLGEPEVEATSGASRETVAVRQGAFGASPGAVTDTTSALAGVTSALGGTTSALAEHRRSGAGADTDALETRVAALEQQVQTLTDELRTLREELS